jgi:AraC-like DNA-binding protein
MLNGGQRWSGPRTLPRHRHPQPYAAVILSGGYDESGTNGRYRVRAGEVLLHRPFDAHVNRFWAGSTRILNIALETSPRFAIGRVADPEAIARLAEADLAQAREELSAQLRPGRSEVLDWPDLLAHDLLTLPQLRLDDWADGHRLTAETLSRGFRKVFSTSPKAFRAEVRTLHAFGLIVDGHMSLAAIASEAGFADQAHMTRAVRELTGRPPGQWRRSSPFKTASAPPPITEE